MVLSQTILWVVIGYFLLLILISRITSRGSDNESFFIGNRKSPWYVVAFGMVGATLSGITFISVPGFVFNQQFSYLQTVLGYVLGYATIAFVLMPMYYRLRLTSIYTYLERRFGQFSYKTGAAYFLLSRIIGASFRLYLVAIVLDTFVMKPLGVPFVGTVAITIVLIWLYTYQSGIKTIVWTDTLQTASMLIAVGVTFFVIAKQMNLGLADIATNIRSDPMSKTWFFSNGWGDTQNFFKMFLAGMFVTIVMTGLDQDMMQKNLSCRNLKDAQKKYDELECCHCIGEYCFPFVGRIAFSICRFCRIRSSIKVKWHGSRYGFSFSHNRSGVFTYICRCIIRFGSYCCCLFKCRFCADCLDHIRLYRLFGFREKYEIRKTKEKNQTDRTYHDVGSTFACNTDFSINQ